MKYVNRWFIDAPLDPFVGGADDDIRLERWGDIDPNDEELVREELIRKVIKPYFERFDPASQEKVKLAMRYCLSDPTFDFERVLAAGLVPFDIPRDSRKFFLWIWEELFPAEDYHL
ncbi:MAG TPA: hypothetical protein EYP14_11735, partial [Planctomycetaceae bacterium]|nr:hypothetical protein [Planctomycetaceae bacterium]